MNDARGLEALHRIAERESRSLTQYMLGVYPWTTTTRSEALDRLQGMIEAERNALVALTRYLYRHKVPPPHSGRYPTDYTSLNFNTDPTHRHAFSSRSFDYLCLDTDLVRYDYSTASFRKLTARMTMRPLTPFNRLLMRLTNRYLSFYEEHLAYIIPGQELLFVLEVIK